MGIDILEVSGLVRTEVPGDGETIATDFDINQMAPDIKEVCMYYRSKEDCPFGRGNLILDITHQDGGIFCIKFPFEMTEQHLMDYIKPLVDEINNIYPLRPMRNLH